jgi:hypothetical protein
MVREAFLARKRFVCSFKVSYARWVGTGKQIQSCDL